MPVHLDSLKRAVSVWITHVLAPHKGIELTPRDTENLDEVKNMLATRIEQREIDIRKKGIEQGIEQVARNLLASGLSVVQVAQLTGSNQKQVNKLNSSQ